MKALLNRLTSDWNLAGVMIAMPAAGLFLLANAGQSSLLWGMFFVCAAVAVGLFMRWQWARYAGIALLVYGCLAKVYALSFREFSWKQAAYAVAYGFIAYGLWKKPDSGWFEDDDDSPDPKADPDSKVDSEPMISLVQLRTQQRYLEAPVLAQALSDAWNLRIVGDDGDAEEADGFVAGRSPQFFAVVRKPVMAVFSVLNVESNYFDESDSVADSMPNLRFAEIIRDHGAWLCVDFMKVMDSQLGETEAYRMIGKAFSALADDQVLAVFCPQHRYFNLWSAEVEDLLTGNDPMAALQVEVAAPVIGVPDGEVIERAIAEARSRWPEFVTTYKNRQPDDDRFLVKAAFTGDDEQVEHMWFTVIGLEPEYVHGHLINDPMHTTKLKKGSQVEVAVGDVSDWICADKEGNPLGNFTHAAIEAAAKGKRKA